MNTRDSVDIGKPLRLVYRDEDSVKGSHVFHAISEDNTLVAVVTVDRESAWVHPGYPLPEWASRQLSQAALDWMAEAVGKRSPGDPDDLREVNLH